MDGAEHVEKRTSSHRCEAEERPASYPLELKTKAKVRQLRRLIGKLVDRP